MQNDNMIRHLREQNSLMDKEKRLRERHGREIDHSRDVEGTASPENVNLLPFVDDSRGQMRREYIKNLTKENKDLDEEKRQMKTFHLNKKKEERAKIQEFHKAASDLERNIKQKNKSFNKDVADYWKKQEENAKKMK